MRLKWQDFEESPQDRLFSMTEGSSPGLTHTLVVDTGDGKYVQFLCPSEGITAEVAGPSRVDEGVGSYMGQRISFFYNGIKDDMVSELGFELPDPDENLMRGNNPQDWARAGADACGSVRDVLDTFPGDAEITIS